MIQSYQKNQYLIADYTTPTAVTASSAASSFASANAKDDNTSTVWKTNAETNPFIYADMGSAVNLCAIAWYNNSATTETTVKIQIIHQMLRLGQIRELF